MTPVYIVSTIAKQIDGDLVHQLIELVTLDKKKAENFVKDHATQHVVTVDNVECTALRGIIEANLE